MSFRHHQPATTRATYELYQQQFKQFCKSKGWEWAHGPNRDAYVASFLQHRAEGKDALARTTLLGPVSGALFDLYRTEENNPMSSALVRDAKKMVKWTAPSPRKAKEALPLEWLRKAVWAARADKNAVTGWRDICILLIMYTALLRQSEVVRLTVDDLRFDSVTEGKTTRKVVMITVRKAKNDQERKGSVRPVPENAEDRVLCLHTALRKYLALRDGRNPVLFYNSRIPDSAGARGVGPALSPNSPALFLRARLAQAGMKPVDVGRYASNSLRKGGATRAFSAGISKLTIKRHGAWRSDAVDSYITVPMSDHWKLVDAILRDEESDVSDADD
jgi:site-specific recombinase XerD